MTEPARSLGRVVCIGGLVQDRRVRSCAPVLTATSNPASITVESGGVAANVARRLAREGLGVDLVSAVGEDDAGRLLLAQAVRAGIGVRDVQVVPGARTAEYVAVLEPDGELFVAAAAMDVLASIGPDEVRSAWPEDGLVFADANLSPRTLAGAIELARLTGVPLTVDAVSVPKSARLPQSLDGVAVLFCNRDEARALSGDPEALPIASAGLIRARGAAAVVLTIGSGGAVVVDEDGLPVHVPGVPVSVRDVTGAGDALIGATIAALSRGSGLVDAVRHAVVAAAEAIGG